MTAARQRKRQRLPRTSAGRWTAVLDFDGTITVEDVADAILRRFGGAEEKDIRGSYQLGVITEDWVRERFLKVSAPRGRIERFVAAFARPRAGFKELLAFCAGAGVPVEVVSGGLDLYVKPLLARWRAGHLKRFCARARFNGRGVGVRYPFLKSGMTLDDFKLGRVRRLRRRGFRVLYAGDGASDLGAAKAADASFARGALWGHCRRLGVPARRLRDFASVRRFLEARLRSRP